jgi:hypothetical protein
MIDKCFHPDCSAAASMAMFACQRCWSELPKHLRLRLNAVALSWINHEVSNAEIEREHDHVRAELRATAVDRRLNNFLKSMGGGK